MKLDLSFKGNLKPQYGPEYNRIASENAVSFNHVIDRISACHSNYIDWWVTGVASRNIFSNPRFHYCCCLVLLKNIIRAGDKISEVRTDSIAFKKIAEGFLSRNRSDIKVRFRRTPIRGNRPSGSSPATQLARPCVLYERTRRSVGSTAESQGPFTGNPPAMTSSVMNQVRTVRFRIHPILTDRGERVNPGQPRPSLSDSIRRGE